MRFFISLIPFLLLLASTSAHKAIQQKEIAGAARPHTVLADTPATIKWVYVIAREGVEAKSAPSDDAETEVLFAYGEMLKVTAGQGDWYKVQKEDREDSPEVYVRKSATGGKYDLALIEEDLNEVFTKYNDEEALTEKVEVSFISREQFYTLKKKSVSYFRPENLVKEGNKTELKVKEGYKTFIDEGENSYNYLGQFSFLNAYLVSWTCGECEEYYYLLIDKTTGEELASFSAFPIFAKDKKWVMCMPLILSNTGNDHAGIDIYTLEGDTIQPYLWEEFENWKGWEHEDGFWGSDKDFYAAIVSSLIYDDITPSTKDAEKIIRYVKIRVRDDYVRPVE